MKVIFLECPILMLSLVWKCKKRKVDLMVYEGMATLSTNMQKGLYMLLLRTSVVLNNHCRHGLLSFLSSLFFYLVLRNLEGVANNCYDITNKSYSEALLTRCTVSRVYIRSMFWFHQIKP